MWIAISIAAICIFFMVFFHKNIRALLDRTRKVTYHGGELETLNPSQELPDTTVSSTEERMREFDSPVLRDQENLINGELTGVRTAPEKEKFLVRALALTKLALAFEQIHSIIWGSQIYILEYLNDRRTLGASKQDIKTSFYDVAIARWPFINPYETYLGFMKASNLIREENESLFITNFGVEFLRYLTSTGKSNARFKPG